MSCACTWLILHSKTGRTEVERSIYWACLIVASCLAQAQVDDLERKRFQAKELSCRFWYCSGFRRSFMSGTRPAELGRSLLQTLPGLWKRWKDHTWPVTRKDRDNTEWSGRGAGCTLWPPTYCLQWINTKYNIFIRNVRNAGPFL